MPVVAASTCGQPYRLRPRRCPLIPIYWGVSDVSDSSDWGDRQEIVLRQRSTVAFGQRHPTTCTRSWIRPRMKTDGCRAAFGHSPFSMRGPSTV
jgi:hypothetical protein